MYRIIGYNEPTDKGGFVVYDPRVDRQVISGELTLKETEVDDLTLKVNQGNPLFDNVRPMHTHIEVYDDKQLIFRGRAIKPKYEMETSGQFTREYIFEDIEAYLMDSVQRFSEFVGQTPKEFLLSLIEVHNGQVDNYKQMQLRKVDVDNPKDNGYRQIDYPKTREAIKEKLLDSIGGYLRVEYNPNGPHYIDYLKDIGEDHKDNTPIQLAKNMKAATMAIDPTKVITRVIPLGKTLEPEKVDVAGDDSSGQLGSPEDFCKSPINATWGCDINKMKQDFMARSNRARAWGVDVNRLYDTIKNAGVSPEWFFAYELCEMLSGGLGWLNHTGRHGDAYQDAQYVCDWIKNTSQSNTISPAWWAAEGSMPANPALAAKWNQEFGKGTIGRVYLQGTAAATWDIANATPWPNNYIGHPIQQCIGFIKSWGGHNGSGGGGWGWPFSPEDGNKPFSLEQSFGPGTGAFRGNGYHDGVDFGAYDHPGRDVHAVHGGTVTHKGYMGGLKWYVVTHSADGFNIVYQEAFSGPGQIRVNIGDKVKTGDVIGWRDLDHCHIGVTKKDFMEAVSHSFDPSGGWMDVRELIKNGGDGSSTPTEDTTYQENNNGPRPKLTIATVNEGKDYIDIPDLQKEFGIIEGKVPFDDIDDPNELLKQAKAWIAAQRIPQSWTVTALELHMPNFKSFKVSDRYMFINPYVAKEQLLRIVEKKVDLLHPYNSQLTIGDKQMGLDDYQVQNQVGLKEFQQVKVLVNQVAQVQETITGGTDRVIANAATSKDLAAMRQNVTNVQNDLSQVMKNYVPVSELEKLRQRVEALENSKGGDDSGS